jgi:hypothetical protein
VPEQGEAQGEALRGWKEIAAVLHASERSVQRWEESMGLPVHRVQGPRGAQIFAYRDELEEWIRSDRGRQARTAAGDRAKANGAESRLRPAGRAGARSRSVLLVVATLVVGACVLIVLGGLESREDTNPHSANTLPSVSNPRVPGRPGQEPGQPQVPLFIKVRVEGSPASIIGVADGGLARVAVPNRSITLGLVPHVTGDWLTVRVFRVEGTTVAGEPLLTELASKDLAVGVPTPCDVTPVPLLLEWVTLPKASAKGATSH